MQQKSTLINIATALLCSILCYGAFQNYQVMQAKAESQVKALDDFQQWKRKYTRLQPLESQWLQKTHHTNTIIDGYTLHRNLLNPPSELQDNPSNPSSTPLFDKIAADTLTVTSTAPLTFESKPLPLISICLSSKATGLISKPHPQLVDILNNLNTSIARADFTFDAFEISLQRDTTPTKQPKNSWTLTYLNPCLLASQPPAPTKP